MSPDRFAHLANQSGMLFVSRGEDKAAAGIVEHLQIFGHPRIRVAIFGQLDGCAGLDRLVGETGVMLKTRSKKALEAPVKVPNEKLIGGNHDSCRQSRRVFRHWRWHSRP